MAFREVLLVDLGDPSHGGATPWPECQPPSLYLCPYPDARRGCKFTANLTQGLLIELDVKHPESRIATIQTWVLL